MLRIRRDGADTLVPPTARRCPGSTRHPPRAVASRCSSMTAPGSPQPLNPQLVQMLSTISQRFPAVFGCSVAAYLWGADDVVSIWTSTGWRAVLGPLDTEDCPAVAAEADRDAGRAQGPAQFRASDVRIPRRRVAGQPGERRIAGASRRGPRRAAADHPRDPATPGRSPSVPPPTPQPTPTPSPSPSTSSDARNGDRQSQALASPTPSPSPSPTPRP